MWVGGCKGDESTSYRQGTNVPSCKPHPAVCCRERGAHDGQGKFSGGGEGGGGVDERGRGRVGALGAWGLLWSFPFGALVGRACRPCWPSSHPAHAPEGTALPAAAQVWLPLCPPLQSNIHVVLLLLLALHPCHQHTHSPTHPTHRASPQQHPAGGAKGGASRAGGGSRPQWVEHVRTHLSAHLSTHPPTHPPIHPPTHLQGRRSTVGNVPVPRGCDQGRRGMSPLWSSLGPWTFL